MLSISTTALQNVMASPLQDISATSVDIQEEPLGFGGSEHLIVTVTRVDDLLDDNGDFLAERVMAVRVNFDVIDSQVCLAPRRSYKLSFAAVINMHTDFLTPPSFLLE